MENKKTSSQIIIKLGYQSDSMDINCLHTAMNRLTNRTDSWWMKFNVRKCKIMHIGKRNTKHVHTMAGQPLQVVDNEPNIGVIIRMTI